MKNLSEIEKTISDTASRIAEMMKEKGIQSINLCFTDKFGLDNPVVLDWGDKNHEGEWENYEIFTLYSSMTADTNLGHVNLLQSDKDEDDWYTLEDVVKDLLGF